MDERIVEKMGEHQDDELKGFYLFFAWIVVIFFVVCLSAVIISFYISWKLTTVGLMIIAWLIYQGNKKEKNEKRYADKILTDMGKELLDERTWQA